MVDNDVARHEETRVPLFLSNDRPGSGVRRLIAGFMHERPGEAPTARGCRTDARIHGCLRGEALQPALRGTVPHDRGAVAYHAEPPARDVQAGHLIQADTACLCLAVLGGRAQGQEDPHRCP